MEDPSKTDFINSADRETASKKEVYFTRDNIRSESMKMLEELMYLRHRKPFVREQTALLILDMQRYFLSEASHAFIPSSTAIVEGINRLVRAFSDHRMPVIVTRHINTPQDAGRMSTWWRELLTEDNPMSRLIDELQCDGAVCLDKCQYDAFYRTPLTDMLIERSVRQIVVCGVMTHLCCESTARSAFVRGFDVFFTIDGTATYNETFHRATLLNLSHGFAVPVLIEEIIAGM